MARLHDDLAELRSARAAWDALAVDCRAPFGAPAWVEAWWRHLRPAGARLAILAVHSGGELVGLLPLYASRRLGVTELRLLSGGFASRLGVLAAAGEEAAVARAAAETLCEGPCRPDLLRWEAVDASFPWAESLSAAWPGKRGHRLRRESLRSAPVVHLGGVSYEEWMSGKSRNFRSQMRRRRRSIEERGASFRRADGASLARDLDELVRLHTARWQGRGGSAAMRPGSKQMLLEAGRALIDSGRFRLWLIEDPDGRAVSAQLFVEAGGEVAYWNGGFDEEWGEYSPGSLAILAAIEEACGRGDALLDLGGGEASYKERLADQDLPVAWIASYPRGPRYPLARLYRLPGQLARSGGQLLRGRLGSERLNRLRGLAGR